MKCPGQDTQYWQPGAIFEAVCPECGASVEFFKDDTTRKCSQCGHRFVNPKMDFGCAAYCQFADQCLGTLPPELLAERSNLLKDRVAIETKRFYQKDFRKIGEAGRAARYAEQMGKPEGLALAAILMAAYLHAVPVADARRMLEKLEAPNALIENVLHLVAAVPEATPKSPLDEKITADACRIAGLASAVKAGQMNTEQALADSRNLLTGAGRSLAASQLA